MTDSCSKLNEISHDLVDQISPNSRESVQKIFFQAVSHPSAYSKCFSITTPIDKHFPIAMTTKARRKGKREKGEIKWLHYPVRLLK
jgi:hypothetical protein